MALNQCSGIPTATNILPMECKYRSTLHLRVVYLKDARVPDRKQSENILRKGTGLLMSRIWKEYISTYKMFPTLTTQYFSVLKVDNPVATTCKVS